jgi:hypothetical protein
MNKLDQDNLVFFLTADADTFRAWYAQATESDKEYASHLMAVYSQELDVRIALSEDTVTDLTDAKTILQKFRLKV